MLELWSALVPQGWVTGDDELGCHTPFRHALRERGERYVLGVPCHTTMRDLEAPLPAYQGRGRRPKPPWQSVTGWRQSLAPEGWTRVTVRDGEKGPVEMEMVTRRVQTRLERKQMGPEEWLVVTRTVPSVRVLMWCNTGSKPMGPSAITATIPTVRAPLSSYSTRTKGGCPR